VPAGRREAPPVEVVEVTSVEMVAVQVPSTTP
jgi:hypothetical protein